jgi:predicted SprT family Zn-dependent metalloprotease
MIRSLLRRPDLSGSWLDFMYDLDFLFDQLNRQYWEGSLPRYRTEWSRRMIVTWGCCYPSRKLIRINSFFRNRPLPELIALLGHEMIHIRISGHGGPFQRELQRIGMPEDVEGLFPHLEKLTHARRRSYRYIYQCPRCALRIHRRNRIRGCCVACHEAGFVSRFKLNARLRNLMAPTDSMQRK